MAKKTTNLLQMHIPIPYEVHELNPSAYNPNKMTPVKFEALKESIKANGMIDPVVVQKNGMNIVGGHHRIKAVKELCVELGIPVPKVPCIVLDLDDEEAKKLNIKLNHIKGEPDARLLGELLVDFYPRETRVDLPKLEAEVLLLGLDVDDASKYMNIIDPIQLDTDSTEPSTFGKSITLSLEFNSVAARDKAKKVIQERAKVEKKKSGDIVMALLGGQKRRGGK